MISSASYKQTIIHQAADTYATNTTADGISNFYITGHHQIRHHEFLVRRVKLRLYPQYESNLEVAE